MIKPIKQILEFKAQWNEENACLKKNSPLPSLSQKIQNFLNAPFRGLCQLLFLPSSFYLESTKQKIESGWNKTWMGQHPKKEHLDLRTRFEPIPLKIETPDGAKLAGTFYKSRKTFQINIPTILYFLPQGGLAKGGIHQWMLKKALKTTRDYHVVIFDYRSCGRSQAPKESPSITAEQLVLDGESVYQCMTTRLGISEDNIRLYGWSLGGGISAQLMALHPKIGGYVNSRSFSSLAAVIYSRHLCLLTKLFQKIASYFGWELNTHGVWEKIYNKTLVVYHPKDQMIPPAAGLVSKAAFANTLELQLKTSIKNTEASIDHHETPYKAYTDQKGRGARKQILNFLLKKQPYHSIWNSPLPQAFTAFPNQRRPITYQIIKGRVNPIC